MSVFKIDGVSYDVGVKSLKRDFQVLDSEDTGRNLGGDLLRDVIGTYYNYTVEIFRKRASNKDYNDLYEKISSPEEFHDIEVPYGDTIYSFKGYIASGSDELKKIQNGENIWGGLSFKMIAKSPKRRPL